MKFSFKMNLLFKTMQNLCQYYKLIMLCGCKRIATALIT